MASKAAPDNVSELGGADRQSFFDRIREALGRSRTEAPSDPAPAVDEALVRVADAGGDLVALFERQATSVGMRVRRVTAAKLAPAIVELLAEVGAQRVVMGVGSLPSALGLREAIRRRNIEVVDWASQPGFACQFEVDAGITDVHAAIAETGSLVCAADAGHSRGLSLVPPIHIAIVRHRDILADQFDYWRQLDRSANDPAAMSSSISLITGPSKTADIEGELITGVHGPGTVVVMLVEE